jgi:hypothetical protein
MRVALDGRNAPGLPVDAEGRTVVDLHSNSDIWTEVPVVQAAGSGTHALTLTVVEQTNPAAQGAKCGIDAFVVRAAPTPAFPYLPLGGFGLAAVLAALGLVRVGRKGR